MIRTLSALSLLCTTPLLAHGGGLDKNGCHNDRKSGGYHCHGGSGSAPAPTYRPATAPSPPASAITASSEPMPEILSLPQLSGYHLNQAIENLLKAADYFGGIPDGQPDRVTLDAAAKFRRDHGLPVASLIMDGALLVRLGEVVLAGTADREIESSVEQRLLALQRLRQQALINEAEYQAQRTKILESL